MPCDQTVVSGLGKPASPLPCALEPWDRPLGLQHVPQRPPCEEEVLQSQQGATREGPPTQPLRCPCSSEAVSCKVPPSLPPIPNGFVVFCVRGDLLHWQTLPLLPTCTDSRGAPVLQASTSQRRGQATGAGPDRRAVPLSCHLCQLCDSQPVTQPGASVSPSTRWGTAPAVLPTGITGRLSRELGPEAPRPGLLGHRGSSGLTGCLVPGPGLVHMHQDVGALGRQGPTCPAPSSNKQPWGQLAEGWVSVPSQHALLPGRLAPWLLMQGVLRLWATTV